jgi:hypothetical protein
MIDRRGTQYLGYVATLFVSVQLLSAESWAQRTAYRLPHPTSIVDDRQSSATGSVPLRDPIARNAPVAEAPSATSVPSTSRVPPADEPAIVLTPELVRMRDAMRYCMAYYYRQPENVEDRSPWGIMHALIPYGVDAQVLANGRRVNAIAWLCANGKGQDLRLFEVRDRQLQPLSGPGMQGHESQFLFMVAQSGVPANYPIQVDRYRFTVADLIEYEKANCQSGTELNFKLVGLVHYLDSDAAWLNRNGERWDIPRIIREELTQPIIGACCGGTHRLMGFSYAVHKRMQRGEPISGQWLRAQKYAQDYQEYAFKLQYPNGSFSTDWFRSRQNSGDPERVLETSGHILEWLAFSLSDEQLLESRMVRSMEFLTRLLIETRDDNLGVGPKGHALHALAIYDERVFGSRPGARTFLAAR